MWLKLSSIVTVREPLACTPSSARTRQGSKYVSLPGSRCVRLRRVATCAVSSRFRHAGWTRDGSGTVRARLPPKPTKPLALPSSTAWRNSTVVWPFFGRRVEAEDVAQLVEGHEVRLLADTDGALALQVGMATDRLAAGTLAANVAAQEQVHEHPDRLGAVDLRGQAHAIDPDDVAGSGISFASLLQLAAGDAGVMFDRRPLGRMGLDDERGVVVAMLVEESMVKHGAAVGFQFQHSLAHAREREQGFDKLAISVRNALLAGQMNIPHKAPFDLLLIAQAQVEGTVLVLNDALFAGFAVKRLWQASLSPVSASQPSRRVSANLRHSSPFLRGTADITDCSRSMTGRLVAKFRAIPRRASRLPANSGAMLGPRIETCATRAAYVVGRIFMR